MIDEKLLITSDTFLRFTIKTTKTDRRASSLADGGRTACQFLSVKLMAWSLGCGAESNEDFPS